MRLPGFDDLELDRRMERRLWRAIGAMWHHCRKSKTQDGISDRAYRRRPREKFYVPFSCRRWRRAD